MPHEVTETHPGWSGSCPVVRADMEMADGSVPPTLIHTAARSAMQAWADDPQCRWWLPGDPVDVRLVEHSTLTEESEYEIRVHIPARFYQWLAPAKDAR